jgi:polyisoprenoid-binding protein YceI
MARVGATRCLVAWLAFSTMSAMAAEPWAVVPESSSVTMFATTQGAWFNGVFESFTATIEFDAEDPASGSIAGVVRTDSFSTEDTQHNSYVRGYLDVGNYPEARFESTSIETTPDGYRATGDLTLTGITKPAALDFTFVAGSESSLPAGHAAFTGWIVINRFDFDIATDVDTDRAGQDVTVQIELELRR